MADADRLVTGLVREFLFRRGFADVLSTFDAETVRAARPRSRPNAPRRAGPAAHHWAPTPPHTT